MKKSIIILLSVLAMAFTFSGCGGSEGSISAAVESVGNTTGDSLQDNDVGSSAISSSTTISEDFGLNPDLGTPPPVPAS